MDIKHIATTDRYTFENLPRKKERALEFESASLLKTYFFHKGSGELEVENGDQIHSYEISEAEGFMITPGTSYRLHTNEDSDIFRVSSSTSEGPVWEIIDDGQSRQEQKLDGVKLIKDIKKVSKPWGYELWICWTRDYHVLKQIKMNAGNRSSLQFHREKLETNYLVEGEADIIDGYHLDPQAPEEEVQASSKGVDFEQYRSTFYPGDYWTSTPGTVHRVIAKTTYLAYEVSTPELDDVIRLQDDKGRVSGRIASEHNRI